MPAKPTKKRTEPKATTAAATAKSKPGRPSIATLAAELDSLRAEMAQLRARLEIVENRPAGAGAPAPAPAVIVAPVATPVASAPAKAPAADNPDPMTEVHELLRQAFALALMPLPDDPDEADAVFERFSGLMHSSRRGTPLLNNSLRNYTWGQLRKNALIYLNDDADPGSYAVDRSEPEVVAPRTERVKFFLKARTRMPTPVTFRRDQGEGRAWRIEASSL